MGLSLSCDGIHWAPLYNLATSIQEHNRTFNQPVDGFVFANGTLFIFIQKDVPQVSRASVGSSTLEPYAVDTEVLKRLGQAARDSLPGCDSRLPGPQQRSRAAEFVTVAATASAPSATPAVVTPSLTAATASAPSAKPSAEAPSGLDTILQLDKMTNLVTILIVVGGLLLLCLCALLLLGIAILCATSLPRGDGRGGGGDRGRTIVAV